MLFGDQVEMARIAAIHKEAKKLLAEVADYPMSLIRFEEDGFLKTKTRYVRGLGIDTVSDFDEHDLLRLQEIVAAMKGRRAALRVSPPRLTPIVRR